MSGAVESIDEIDAVETHGAFAVCAVFVVAGGLGGLAISAQVDCYDCVGGCEGWGDVAPDMMGLGESGDVSMVVRLLL